VIAFLCLLPFGLAVGALVLNALQNKQIGEPEDSLTPLGRKSRAIVEAAEASRAAKLSQKIEDHARLQSKRLRQNRRRGN